MELLDNDIALNNIKILLVEDSHSDVILFKHMLKDDATANYDITDIPRLGAAFGLLESNHYDVVVLDLSVLDMEGFATVAALHIKAPEVPIIVHSGSLDPSMESRAFLCGAKKFLLKGSVNSQQLKLAIDQAMQKSWEY